MTALFAFHASADLPEGRRRQICDWLTSIGVDPNNVRDGHIMQTANGYDLHLTEMGTDEEGRRVLDAWRANEVVTAKRIVQLGDVADWPGAGG